MERLDQITEGGTALTTTAVRIASLVCLRRRGATTEIAPGTIVRTKIRLGAITKDATSSQVHLWVARSLSATIAANVVDPSSGIAAEINANDEVLMSDTHNFDANATVDCLGEPGEYGVYELKTMRKLETDEELVLMGRCESGGATILGHVVTLWYKLA